MAAPMWRMNGVWKRMAGVLLLCTLLLCNDVTCQDDEPANNTDASASAAPGATSIPYRYTTLLPAPAATAAVDDALASSMGLPPIFATTVYDLNRRASGSTAAPSVTMMMPGASEATEDFSGSTPMPGVSCVDLDEVTNTNYLLVVVDTDDCEDTKRIIQDQHELWCKEQPCDIKLHQDGKNLYAGSENVGIATLQNTFQTGPLKEKLTRSPSSPSSSDSSVFVGVLVSGLLAALALTVGYFKCQRRSETKGVRLAEETYPVDQENQGNTLVSVAPLNPPPETPEKPSVNGESPEVVKTEPTPPTNGHSTTNTADTEM